MADGPLYSKLMAEDNGFYIMRNGDETLATGVSFVVPENVGLLSLTMPSQSGTLALAGATSSVSASDITPGSGDVKITTTAGNGVSIITNNGTSLILGYNDGTNDLTQVALGLSTMFLGDNNGGSYTISHNSQNGNDDFIIAEAGTSGSLQILSSSTAQNAIDINASAGNLILQSATGLSVQLEGGDAMILSDGQLTLGSTGTTYTIDHSTDGALTIQQSGSADLVVRNTSGTGFIDINTSSSKAVKLQNNTYQYAINDDTDATTNQQVIWSTTDFASGTSSSIFVNSQFSAVDPTGDYASGYEGKAIYYWDEATITLQSQQIISHGDISSTENGTDLVFSVDGSTIRLQYTPKNANTIKLRGLATITTTN